MAIPEDVCLEAEAHASAGMIDIDGNEVDGFDVDADAGLGSSETPRLSLDAEVEAGVIRVIGDDDIVLDTDRDFDREFDRLNRVGRATAPVECAA